MIVHLWSRSTISQLSLPSFTQICNRAKRKCCTAQKCTLYANTSYTYGNKNWRFAQIKAECQSCMTADMSEQKSMTRHFYVSDCKDTTKVFSLFVYFANYRANVLKLNLFMFLLFLWFRHEGVLLLWLRIWVLIVTSAKISSCNCREYLALPF